MRDDSQKLFSQREFAILNNAKLYIYIYADDIAIVLVRNLPHIPQQASVEPHQDTVSVLGGLLLDLSVPKCNNLALSPGGFAGKIFRRNSGLTKTARKDAHKRDERIAKLAGSLQAESEKEGIFPEELKLRLPYNYQSVIKILGLHLDGKLGFTGYATTMVSKAMVRHGVMAQLASTTWGRAPKYTPGTGGQPSSIWSGYVRQPHLRKAN